MTKNVLQESGSSRTESYIRLSFFVARLLATVLFFAAYFSRRITVKLIDIGVWLSAVQLTPE
jgi:hypothetical protein